MATLTAKRLGGGAAAAGAIAAAMTLTPMWEGLKLVASRDPVGTNHPVDYCYGQTDEFGTVKVGTRFTKQQCDALLAESMPHYWALIEPCIKVALPHKTAGALLDAAYNAGPAAVCSSPMLKKMNAGDIRGGCNAFAGWYITSKNNGVRAEVPGLIARRTGRKGDPRKTERDLCLEGAAEAVENREASPAVAPTAAPAPAKKPWWKWS